MTSIPHENKIFGWRCFHCGEYFNNQERPQAEEHFGAHQGAEPACQIKQHERGLVGFIREIESELEEYRNEDTPLHRQISRLICDHAQALQREEEKGYARGLKDGREIPTEGSS